MTDNCACTSSDTLMVTGATRINSFEQEHHIAIFPNPSSDILIIRNHSKEKNLIAVITDIYGKEIFRTLIEGESIVINANHFSDGIYFISVLADKEILLTEKLIKAH